HTADVSVDYYRKILEGLLRNSFAIASQLHSRTRTIGTATRSKYIETLEHASVDYIGNVFGGLFPFGPFNIFRRRQRVVLRLDGDSSSSLHT
ncbi:hypothetical protein ANCDUO_19678, partial [Ancylostoma duodenale]